MSSEVIGCILSRFYRISKTSICAEFNIYFSEINFFKRNAGLNGNVFLLSLSIAKQYRKLNTK